MNENDGRDREVREYVRNRMAADLPPEFTRDVMNDVHRTQQRRRGIAWPILAGLATVAAAIAVVAIGLALINQPGGVGSEPTSPPSASVATTPSLTPEVSSSEEPTPSPTTEPTTGQGEFGPIHSMAPDEAFPNAQTCQVTDAIVNAEPTELSWSVSFPDGWFTNEESTDLRSACTLFDSEPVGVSDDQSTVAIVTEGSPGGDFTTDGAVVTTLGYTVDGVTALRYEIEPGEAGFVTQPMVVWVIAIGGNLPAVGNDQPYLIFQTYSDDREELAEWADVLDRMVATLDIGE